VIRAAVIVLALRLRRPAAERCAMLADDAVLPTWNGIEPGFWSRVRGWDDRENMHVLRHRGAPVDPMQVQPAYRLHRGGGLSGMGRRRHRRDRGALRLFGHSRA
jgi:hypothetical protein